MEEIKTELTEEELIKIYGELPKIPDEVPAKPKNHDKVINNE